MLLQMHLVPQGSPDGFDIDDFVDDDYEKFNQKYKEGQLRQVRSNLALRRRLLEIAEEAEMLGTF